MELASFDPGPGGLSTTESNSPQSRSLSHLILESVTGDAAGMFDNRPDLKGKGFKMVALLRGKHRPRGEDSMCGAFLKLSDMKQLVEETATAYFQRNRSLCTELVECKIPLPPTLLSMFAVRGLSDQFLSVRNHFTMNPGLFASMELSAIETFTEVHANSARMLGTGAPDQPATYAAAAAAAAALTDTPPSTETAALV